MGADDQNAEAGIMGAGSGGPPATMRAVVLDAPGPPSALAIRELPVPVPPAGWVLIRVRAFGLNRLELYLRLGLSQGGTFPRVPGVEAAGVVEQCPGGEFRATTSRSRHGTPPGRGRWRQNSGSAHTRPRSPTP